MNISPITASIQAEINAFYDFAKEDEEGKRVVHKLYVLSILRNIERHTGTKLHVYVAKKRPFFHFNQDVSDEELLVQKVDSMDSTYLSLIQLTNILACANRQITSDTLVGLRK